MSSQGMGINEAKYYRLHITALISLICSLYLSGLPRHSLMANSISQYKLTTEAISKTVQWQKKLSLQVLYIESPNERLVPQLEPFPGQDVTVG